MSVRTLPLRVVAGVWLISTSPVVARAQDRPVQRIANLVAIAVAEYGKGIDAQGRLTSADEYNEVIGLLADAHSSSMRLPAGRQPAVALLDSIIAAVNAKRPPTVLAELEKRFIADLGTAGQLNLPTGRLDPDSGRLLYAVNCSSCHGVRGMGDGPAGIGLNPRPPALANPEAMRAESPSLMFRKVELGVTGTAMPAFGTKLSAADRWNIVAYLTELRHAKSDIGFGEGLYVQSCASCHGARGTGDGPLARSLSKLPPDVGSFAWEVQRSDSELAVVIRRGVPGSPMPPMTTVSLAQEQAIVAYLRRLSIEAQPSGLSGDSASPEVYAKQSISLLEQSLSSAKSGRLDDASDRATDAYVKFEPIETTSRMKSPGLVSTMEQLYGRFKSAIQSNDIRRAEQAQAEIEGNMPAVLALTTPSGSGIDAFWQSFLIILREGFEAILVVGAVVALLIKTGHRERLRSIWTGVVLALIASAVTAVLLKTILGSIPASSELIEGMTLLVAVVVLFSVSYWLISRVEAAKWQQFIKEKVSDALEHGGGRALTIVAFLAVYREGAETALFYQALFNNTQVALPIGLGILAGAAALAVIFTLFYKYGVRIPLRPFFGVTSVLLYYMAFVFTGKGVRELQEGGVVPATFIPHFPTIDWLGLHPTWQSLTAQFILLVLFAFAVLKTFWPRRSVALPTVEPSAATGATPQIAQLLARIEVLEKRVSDGQSGSK